MRCRYRENIYKCGEFLEVDIFPTFDKKKGGRIARRSRFRETSGMQARLNQRNAEKALVRLLNANFTTGDIEIALTYDNEHLPSKYEDAVRDVTNYLRRVKRMRDKLGLPEMKRVTVPGAGRFHFHIVMSGGVPREILETLWGKGFANSRRLEANRDGFAGIANYIAAQLDPDMNTDDLFSAYDINEETGELTERDGHKANRAKNAKRFTCSNNIVRPEPEIKDGRISQKKVEELATVSSASAKEFNKIYDGYEFVRCEPYYNSEYGGWYIHVRMRKRDERKRRSEGVARRQNYNEF